MPEDVSIAPRSSGARHDDQVNERHDGVVRLELPIASQYIRVARLVASGLGASAGLDVDAVDDLRIAVDELCAAADRDVDVQILLPGPHIDKRFVQVAAEGEYQRLLDHGISIWNFQPTMLHAKVMTVDGAVANVGSANVNTRSVTWDEEVNVVAMDKPLARLLDAQFDEDLERSVRIEPARWERRAAWQRAAERAVAPIKRYF